MRANDGDTRDRETPDDIIAYARDRALTITRAQLERWHTRGPLHHPEQVWLGQGRGSETRYPRGTAELVVAALQRQPRPRDLTMLTWELWLAGYDVPLETVRAYLANVARWHDRIVAAMRTLGFARRVLPGPARRLLGRAAIRRMRVRGLPGIATRLGSPERVETVLRTLGQVLTGGYKQSYQVAIHDGGVAVDGRALPSTDSDGLLLERAIGIERGRVDRLAGAGPWLSGDPTEGLVALTKMLGGWWLPIVRDTSDHELRAVRDQARDLEELFVTFGDFVREHFGADAFGFPAIADALRSPTSWQQAGLAMVLVRALKDEELRGVALFREMAERWRSDLAPKVAAMRTLRHEVPALQELLAPRRIGEAMRDEARLAAFQDELRMVAEANRDRIESVVSRLAPSLSFN
ncbi:MAG: hypothetical protein HY553_08980 [Elusimicrobia bacterium]|nr:hypothetical protein [Elusimicrobiota bacterium]